MRSVHSFLLCVAEEAGFICPQRRHPLSALYQRSIHNFLKKDSPLAGVLHKGRKCVGSLGKEISFLSLTLPPPPAFSPCQVTSSKGVSLERPKELCSSIKEARLLGNQLLGPAVQQSSHSKLAVSILEVGSQVFLPGWFYSRSTAPSGHVSSQPEKVTTGGELPFCPLPRNGDDGSLRHLICNWKGVFFVHPGCNFRSHMSAFLPLSL